MVVGRVTRVHGAAGAVRVRVESDHPQRFVPRARFRTRLADFPLLVAKSVRADSAGAITEFAGITSPEQAARLVGADLFITTQERRPLQPGEFWPDQLSGLEARVGSVAFGVVTDLVDAPQPRLVIARPGKPSVEVPFVSPLVPEVNLAEGWLRLDPPPGLLP